MNIAHVAMYVSDLEGAKAFFVKYFDAVANDGYLNANTRFRSYFMSFENGAQLEIMTRPECVPTEFEQFRCGYAHLAFSTGSKEKVDSLTKQLVADGYTLLSGPRTTGDGYYESCILAFEDNIIEITV